MLILGCMVLVDRELSGHKVFFRSIWVHLLPYGLFLSHKVKNSNLFIQKNCLVRKSAYLRAVDSIIAFKSTFTVSPSFNDLLIAIQSQISCISKTYTLNFGICFDVTLPKMRLIGVITGASIRKTNT